MISAIANMEHQQPLAVATEKPLLTDEEKNTFAIIETLKRCFALLAHSSRE